MRFSKARGPTTAGGENPGLRGLSSVADPVSHRTPCSGKQTYSVQHPTTFSRGADLVLFNTFQAENGEEFQMSTRTFGPEGSSFPGDGTRPGQP